MLYYIHELELEFLRDSNLSLCQMVRRKIPFQNENLIMVPLKDGAELDFIGYIYKA